MIISNQIKLFFLMVFALGFCKTAFSNTAYFTKAWIGADLLKSLPTNDKFVYLLSAQYRSDISEPFLDRYNFQAGVGYQILSHSIVWLGYQLLTKNVSDPNNQQHRLWQQHVWVPIDSSTFNFVLRSRLQEGKRETKDQWHVVLRERAIVRFPCLLHKKVTPVIYDEIFINFNHPEWTPTNKTIDRNRLFIGFDITMSKKQALEVGYLNQYHWRGNPNEMDNVLIVSYIFN